MELSEILLVIMLVVSALTVIAVAVVIFLLVNLRNKIAVQKLKFLGFYAQDTLTRENYAEFVVGNKSLNEVGIAEMGLRNGTVTFDLTGLYKRRAGLRKDDRLVIEQRSSIRFRLSEEDLASVLVDGKKGKMLGSLKIYCVDLTGTLYTGKLNGVKKLAQKVLNEIGNGKYPSATAEKTPVSECAAAPETGEGAEE